MCAHNFIMNIPTCLYKYTLRNRLTVHHLKLFTFGSPRIIPKYNEYIVFGAIDLEAKITVCTRMSKCRQTLSAGGLLPSFLLMFHKIIKSNNFFRKLLYKLSSLKKLTSIQVVIEYEHVVHPVQWSSFNTTFKVIYPFLH